MQGIGAIAIFTLIVFLWRLIWVKQGNIGFWQLVADKPDLAFDWMRNHSDWIVVEPDDPEVDKLEESPDFVGPFKLWVPQIGGKILVFAANKSVNESQKEFIDLFGGIKEQSKFPWLSAISMIYPIVAMINFSIRGAPLIPTLGYGFLNLGHLLLFAGIFAGSFHALGLRYRLPTLIAAVVVWCGGILLYNF